MIEVVIITVITLALIGIYLIGHERMSLGFKEAAERVKKEERAEAAQRVKDDRC